MDVSKSRFENKTRNVITNQSLNETTEVLHLFVGQPGFCIDERQHSGEKKYI
jgi:hypothetical protein